MATNKRVLKIEKTILQLLSDRVEIGVSDVAAELGLSASDEADRKAIETKRLIELGEAAVGKDLSEAQMILNHKSAIEYIVESTTDEQITAHEVCSLHALLSENLLGDPGASGRVRDDCRVDRWKYICSTG